MQPTAEAAPRCFPLSPVVHRPASRLEAGYRRFVGFCVYVWLRHLDRRVCSQLRKQFEVAVTGPETEISATDATWSAPVYATPQG